MNEENKIYMVIVKVETRLHNKLDRVRVRIRI